MNPTITPALRRAGLLGAALVALTLLAGCGSDAATKPAGPGAKTKVGVSVSGKFGQKPTLDVPVKDAPKELSGEVISAGTGPVVQQGDMLVVDYLGQTWATKGGKPNVFDNSFDRKQVANFQIGVGQVIKGWDETVVGQRVGSRLLLTLPPDVAYGGDSTSPLAKDTLLFVVDVVSAYSTKATASGQPVGLPTGFPKVSVTANQPAQITDLSVVKPGTKPISALVIKGSGEKIDATKQLAVQVTQTDLATGRQTRQTYGQGAQVYPAAEILATAPILTGAPLGSRAVVIVPKSAQSEASVLVYDVLGQF